MLPFFRRSLSPAQSVSYVTYLGFALSPDNTALPLANWTQFMAFALCSEADAALNTFPTIMHMY